MRPFEENSSEDKMHDVALNSLTAILFINIVFIIGADSYERDFT